MSLEEQIVFQDIGRTESQQDWLKSSATIQVVSKPQRKDGAPGAGLSHPALANRRSAVGKYEANCLQALPGKSALTIFSDFSRVHAGPPGLGKDHCWQRWNSNPRPPRDWSLNPAPYTSRPRYPGRPLFVGPFLSFHPPEIEAMPAAELLRETRRVRPSKALCSAIAATRVFQKASFVLAIIHKNVFNQIFQWVTLAVFIPLDYLLLFTIVLFKFFFLFWSTSVMIVNYWCPCFNRVPLLERSRGWDRLPVLKKQGKLKWLSLDEQAGFLKGFAVLRSVSIILNYSLLFAIILFKYIFLNISLQWL